MSALALATSIWHFMGSSRQRNKARKIRGPQITKKEANLSNSQMTLSSTDDENSVESTKKLLKEVSLGKL